MHFSLTLLILGPTLLGQYALGNPIAVSAVPEEPTFPYLEPRIAPLVVLLTVEVLPVLIEGGAFGGAVAQAMFGEMAHKEPYNSKETCRIELTASKNKKFGEWGVSALLFLYLLGSRGWDPGSFSGEWRERLADIQSGCSAAG